MTEYRLYSFVNMYLSDIQRGIQTAHLVHELFTKKPNYKHVEQIDVLNEWAENHKTIIVLNGGYSDNLKDIRYQLDRWADVYQLPMAYFNEGEDAPNGALTCVGIILPSDIYDLDFEGLDMENEILGLDVRVWMDQFKLA
jgi:hypothetical protein